MKTGYILSQGEVRELKKENKELKEKLDVTEISFYKEREKHNGTKKAVDVFRNLSQRQIDELENLKDMLDTSKQSRLELTEDNKCLVKKYKDCFKEMNENERELYKSKTDNIAYEKFILRLAKSGVVE